MDVSGCEEAESAVSKDLPDETKQLKSSSEDVSMEGGPIFEDYFDDYDYYYPPAFENEMFFQDEKPIYMDLPDEPQEKATTPREDIIQDGESVPVGSPQNDFARGESKREYTGGIGDTFKRDEIQETIDQSEGATLVSSMKEENQDSVDQSDDLLLVNCVKEEIPEDDSDTLRTEEIRDCVHQSQETPRVNSNNANNEDISEGISDTKDVVQETIEERERTPQENSDNNGIPEGTGTARVGISEETQLNIKIVSETVTPMEEVFVSSVKEEIPGDISDTFKRKEIQDCVDQSQETPLVNSNNEDISEDISDTFRREEIRETIEQREKMPQENSDTNGIPEGTGTVRVGNSEKTQVNIEIVSETVTPMEEVSDTQTPVGTNEDRPKFTKEQREKIWNLAKKLCEARVAYSQNVCRPTTAVVNRQLPPKKRKHAETLVAQCRRSRLPDTMTNGGICTVGKGDDSQYEDPPEWDWGQPLPKELCEVIPTRPDPETPTISLVDDECPPSSTCFEKASSPRRKRMKPRAPVSKSLKISISVTRFKNSSDTTVVLSDSDEELPDFSMELGIPPRKAEPRPPECLDLSDGGSCTVIRSAVPQQLVPTTRLTVRKRRRPTENRAPAGSSFPNVNPHEVVVLGSSDESDDPDLEVLQVAKKPAPSEAPQKPNSKPKTDEKETWSCPICLEPKDKVPNIMSTTCGHIFCGPCLQSTIRINKRCPNCRKKLTLRQIHNLYL